MKRSNHLLPIDEFHNKAMELATTAHFAERKKQSKKVDIQALYTQAFEYEKAAAMLLVNNYEMEPTRAVYFRSAASLILSLPTISAAQYQEAERMIAFGLSGYPHPEIAAELREVRQELEQKYQQQKWQQTLFAKGKSFEQQGVFTAVDLKAMSFEFEVSNEVAWKGVYPVSLDKKIRQISFEQAYVIKGEICEEQAMVVLADLNSVAI